MVWSSSLWGCELKRICKWYHPLRIRHPPCEDVSWKGCECEYCDDENVILLVRMWVEKMAGWFLFPLSIRHPPCEDVSWKINWCAFPRGGACHPPCEDVSWKLAHTMNLICPLCHPPCEDVSWKDDELNLKALLDVILHVRMWVEKSYTTCSAAFTIVILLVRMWVEKTISSIYRQKVSSSSMWGCELKNIRWCWETIGKPSSSMWGCELKSEWSIHQKR